MVPRTMVVSGPARGVRLFVKAEKETDSEGKVATMTETGEGRYVSGRLTKV